MESVEFGNDFFDSLEGGMEEDENFIEARKEWEASKKKVLPTKKVR